MQIRQNCFRASRFLFTAKMTAMLAAACCLFASKFAHAESDALPLGLLQTAEASQFFSPYVFLVDKESRTLNVWQATKNGSEKIATFPADLGKAAGDKRNSGDHRTPEGIYFLQDRLEGDSLDFKLYGSRAFTTDYPNLFDQREGKTGSGIWLHAVPDDVPLTRGSRGCVVVRNNAIAELSKYVRLGRTPIIIQDKTELAPKVEHERLAKQINGWLESWRTAWQTKNIESYIEKYGDSFQALKMDKSAWKEYKTRLNSQYQSIAVKISKPVIILSRNRAVVKFLQEYSSDHHSDFGDKTLYLERESQNLNAEYRIIGETWSPQSIEIAREEIGKSDLLIKGGNEARLRDVSGQLSGQVKSQAAEGTPARASNN